MTVSLGVSSAAGDDVDYDSLFRAADGALYEAKRRGRNQVVGVRPALTTELPSVAADIDAFLGMSAPAPSLGAS